MEHILKTKATGFINDKPSNNPYRFLLYKSKAGDRWLLRPELSFKKDEGFEFNKYSSLPSWNLSTLIKDMIKGELSDTIAIDADQDWYASGMHSAVKESLDYV